MKAKRYTTTSAKKHVLSTSPFRVTRNTRKESYDNEDYETAYNELDTSLQNILVAFANTNLDRKLIMLVNFFMRKVTKAIEKELKKNK